MIPVVSVSAEKILRLAEAEIGYKESPDGSNRTKYGAWYGLDGQPWCMMFIQWVFAQAGAAELLPMKTASCGQLMRAAQAAGLWATGHYQPGDVVVFDFPGGAATDHCGIIASVTANYAVSIEGNTALGNDSNGGEVMRRTRGVSQILGAVRPKYSSKEAQAVATYKYLRDVPEKFRPIISDLMTANIIQGDGSDPTGNGDVINLTHEQVRTLVFVYRGGGFDRQMQAKGLPVAVKT